LACSGIMKNDFVAFSGVGLLVEQGLFGLEL